MSGFTVFGVKPVLPAGVLAQTKVTPVRPNVAQTLKQNAKIKKEQHFTKQATLKKEAARAEKAGGIKYTATKPYKETPINRNMDTTKGDSLAKQQASDTAGLIKDMKAVKRQRELQKNISTNHVNTYRKTNILGFF